MLSAAPPSATEQSSILELSSSGTDPAEYWGRVAGCGTAVGMPPFSFRMAGASGVSSGLDSWLRWQPGSDGVHFLESFVDARVHQAAFRGTQGDAIVVGCLRRGRLEIRHNGQDITVFEPGELMVSDYGRRMEMSWDAHRFLFLVLPRRIVRDVLGLTDGLGGRTIEKLRPTGLAPFVSRQLLTLADHGSRLNPDEWGTAHSALRDMALMMLRQQLTRRDLRHSADTLHLGTLLAAQNFIRLHYHRADLTADHIAAGLRCSRAHLFRVFATHGLTVSAYLRETRLTRAKEMLESGPWQMSIGSIAWSCGYSDLSAFGKAFRRRFGCAPNVVRTGPPVKIASTVTGSPGTQSAVPDSRSYLSTQS